MDVPSPLPSHTDLNSLAGVNQPAPRLTYDPEWLAITRAFHPYLSTTRMQPIYPDEEAARKMIQEELEWVKNNIHNKNDAAGTGMGVRDVSDCQVFVMTAPGPGLEGSAKFQQRKSSVPHSRLFLCSLFFVVFPAVNPDLPEPFFFWLFFLSTVVYKPTDRSFLRHASSGEQNQSTATKHDEIIAGSRS